MRSTTCDDESLTVKDSNDPYHWYLKTVSVSVVLLVAFVLPVNQCFYQLTLFWCYSLLLDSQLAVPFLGLIRMVPPVI